MSSRILCVLFILMLTACASSSTQQPASLTIFAAASLSAPFEEIGKQFSDSHPGVNLTFNFAGSQQLAQQLAQGAPCDLFASASQGYMDQAVQDGRVRAGNWSIFARNQLTVIYNKAHPPEVLDLASLTQPGLRLVLAAPEVPVGKYTQQFLDKAAQDPAYGTKFRERLLANVVSYEDNVKVVLAKVVLAEADAGIVYTSDLSDQSATKVGQIAIPEALNVTATYPMAVISDSAESKMAQALLDYILSPDGQAILSSYGFLSPTP